MAQPPPLGSRYRFDALLGGTTSRVHRAHDLLLQRDVAIKSFPGDEGPQRWLRDGLLRQRLGPDQAVQVLDGAPDGDDGPFTVMTLARAGSLDRLAGPWDPWPVALLVGRLAPGLGHLHGLGVVHGAVAADAVLLDPQHGPRWAGHGGVPAAGATPEDDVAALARVVAGVVTGRPADAPEPSDEVLDAVRALVLGPVDNAALLRLHTGLVDDAARIGVRRPVVAPARRVRRTVLAACTVAAVIGGAVGVGTGVLAGDGPTAVAADVAGGPVPTPVMPPLVVPPRPVAVPVAPAEVRETPAPRGVRSVRGGGGRAAEPEPVARAGGADRAERDGGDERPRRGPERHTDADRDRDGRGAGRDDAGGERDQDRERHRDRADGRDGHRGGDRGGDRGEDRGEDRGGDRGEDRGEDRRSDEERGSGDRSDAGSDRDTRGGRDDDRSGSA